MSFLADVKRWWRGGREDRVRRYLTEHRDITAEMLRRDPELGVAAVRHAIQRAHGIDPLDISAAMTKERRTLEYPVLSQLGSGGRQSVSLSLPKVTPFNMRRFSEYPPSRRAINAISNPILDMAWVIEPIPDLFDPPSGTGVKNEPSGDQKTRIEGITNALRNPNDDISWRTWLEMVLEDIVVGGYGASEVAMTQDRKRPFFLWPVDGQSVRINVKWDGDPNKWRYTQSLGYVGISVGTTDVVTLKDSELLYFRLNPRTNTPFGLGYLETAFSTVNAYIGAFRYAERRASNATPAYALFLGENIDVATARQWQMYWMQEIEGFGRVPIIGGGRQPEVLKLGAEGNSDDQLYIKWQEFLIRVIAMSFGLSPMKLGLERDVNRSTSESQDASDWETVAPVANVVQDLITSKLLHNLLGYTDLRFKWLIKDTDEMRQAEILQIRWDMNSITANEIRKVYDDEPWDEPIGDMGKLEGEAFAEGAKTALKAGAKPPQDDLPRLGGPPGAEAQNGVPAQKNDAGANLALKRPPGAASSKKEE